MQVQTVREKGALRLSFWENVNGRQRKASHDRTVVRTCVVVLQPAATNSKGPFCEGQQGCHDNAPPPPRDLLEGRALWGQTHSSYTAVGAHCKIGWGPVTGGWKGLWGEYWGCGRAFR